MAAFEHDHRTFILFDRSEVGIEAEGFDLIGSGKIVGFLKQIHWYCSVRV
jgi:hypothetical protein